MFIQAICLADRPPPLYLPNGAVPTLAGLPGPSSLHRAPSTSTNASAASTPSSIDHSDGSPNISVSRARSVSNAAVARRKESSTSLQQQLLAHKPHDLAHGHNHHVNSHGYSPYPHTSHSHPASMPRSAPLTRSPSNASSAASRQRSFDPLNHNNQNIILNTHQTGLETPPDLVRRGDRMFELPPLHDAEPKFELPPAIKLEDTSSRGGSVSGAISMPMPAVERSFNYVPSEPHSIKSTGSWPANAEPPISGPPTFDEPAGWRLDAVQNEPAANDFDLSAEIDRWRHVLELEFDPSEMGAAGSSVSSNAAPVPTPPSVTSSSASSFVEEWAPAQPLQQQQQQHQQQQLQQFQQPPQVHFPSASPSPSLFEPDFPPSASAYEWQNDGVDPWSAYRANDGAFYSASASSSSSAAGSEYSFNLETGSVNSSSANGGGGDFGAGASVDTDETGYDPTLALSFADFDLSLAVPPSVVLQQQQQHRSAVEEEESEEEERQRIRDAMARRGPSGDSRLALDREETWRPGRRTPDG